MLSLVLLFISSLAYDANKCDCHMVLGFMDGEKVCDALNICSASDVDLNLMELAPLYLPTVLATPGLQLTNIVSSELLNSGYQDDKYCELCESVVKEAEDELPTIEPKLEAICSKLNSTVKTLLCQKAIKKVFEEIESHEPTPETICEKVKLCNSTSIVFGEEKKVELPKIDFCSICEKVVQKGEDELPVIEPKLEAACSRLNSTVKTLVCQKAIKKAFEEIESNEPTAETVCEKVKLCNSTSIIIGEEKPNVDFCAACEKVWDFAQKYDTEIKTALDALCQKLGSTTKDKACELAVNYVTSWIDSHSAQVACADVHLCNSTSLNARILA